jgi:N-methylhydantoinase A/oxoprolinase/acetone carboxylase beta subunit
VREVIERMRKEALHDMKGEGITPDRVQLSLEAEVAGADGKLTSVVEEISSTAPVDLRFLDTSQGTVELLRLRATASMAHYEVVRHAPNGHSPAEAVKGHRDVIWEALRPGHEVSGGAILESAWTTYPVLPGWSLRIDEYGNGHLQRR